MSGTSLDGLDLCLVNFSGNEDDWSFNIEKAVTIEYPPNIRILLANCQNYNAPQFIESHLEFSRSCGHFVKAFLTDIKTPEFLAFHGHTIFHDPKKKITFQLGSGAALASATSIPVVCDFRMQDVELGGQGAPLVPLGDMTLFGKYESCLNLGGFANISFGRKKRIAFDICPVNYVLNLLSLREGRSYDEGGEMARSGKMLDNLYAILNNLKYYSEPTPKSLGREWVEENIHPHLENHDTADLLNTIVHHCSSQISKVLNENKLKNVLVTGGGAFNTFLIEKIREQTSCEIILPDAQTINFKEALIFAFLGGLRMNQRANVLSSVTGSARNHCAGAIYM